MEKEKRCGGFESEGTVRLRVNLRKQTTKMRRQEKAAVAAVIGGTSREDSGGRWWWKGVGYGEGMGEIGRDGILREEIYD